MSAFIGLEFCQTEEDKARNIHSTAFPFLLHCLPSSASAPVCKLSNLR